MPLALATAGCHRAAAPEPPPITVAAAADLSRAFREIGDGFEKRSGRKVVFSFGSSGLLARQIAEGAPFDLYAAANQSYVDDVVRAGACEGSTRALYARGRIVLWTRRGASVARPVTVADLASPRYARIAIANPEHAPYGRAAEQALRKAGVWEAVRPRLVYGENVQQALQFAVSGNAEVAIVALSLAVVSDGEYTPIDAALHEPLAQSLVVCRHGAASQAAGDLASYIGSPEGRAIMRRHGFALPEEQGPVSP